ncbi:MAG: PTS mannose transporter subunit IIA, partial [Firmicutes bacterium]|nr:PTS mannose transporter subunit IIA [Candidatus Colivicinus equi]
MKGIIITSHGEMANGILDTSKLFFGEQPQMKAFCLKATDNPDDFVEVLKKGIEEVDTG